MIFTFIEGVIMSQRFYSPKTAGFFDSRIHKAMPDDVIKISDDHYLSLLAGQAEGLSIQYQDGVVSLVASETSAATVLQRLEADLHRYIEDAHGYSIPTQATFQAVAADPSTPEDIRDQCRSVSRWIQSSVLPYYYRIKADILSLEKPMYAVWDFPGTCDSTAPGVFLANVISRLE